MAIDWGLPCAGWKSNMEGWQLIVDLLGGANAMRKNHTYWLPQWGRELGKDYLARVQRTPLYNAFRRTVRTLSAKPFTDPVKVVQQPEALQVLESDTDREGANLTRFTRMELADMIAFGIAHWLVDSPTFTGTLTKKAESDLNIHPYFCRVLPPALIWWKHVRGMTGDLILEEIRIKSEECNADTDKEYDIITRWTRDSIEVYRREKGSTKVEDWTQDSSKPNLLGVVPLITVPADASKKSTFEASAPLEDLAELNLYHYRSSSDQAAALHFARVPFLHFAGFKKEEVDSTVAANNAYVSTNAQSKITVVETTGAAIEAGVKDLDATESRMDVMGSDLLVQQPGNPTATAKSIDTAEKVSDLQAMVMALEGGLESAYELAGEWIHQPLNMEGDNPDIDVQLDTAFGLSLNDKSELDFLLKARLAGEISRELFYDEIQRRGIFEEFDQTAELNKVAAEAKQDMANQIKVDDSKPAPQPAPAAK